MDETRRTPVAITIAGSDSGGGAGIQADLKAFARCGVHGTSAIVALTAQNTLGVTSIHTVPPEMVVDQVRAVVTDIGVDAVKVGMLGDEATIAAVEQALELTGDAPVVVDPVMVAESGAVLLEPDSVRALIERILPRAAVATPNLPEARELTGLGPDATPEDLARAVQALGPDVAVVTGGHGGSGADAFFDGRTFEPIEGPRHADGAAHGSGCTHSSALAAQLALGAEPLEAARVARRIAAEAVANGLRDVGAGPGPVDVLGVRDRAADVQRA
jgi:hydroxymethylpyrimidine/phosphomethylpyrimidine kinase